MVAGKTDVVSKHILLPSAFVCLAPCSAAVFTNLSQIHAGLSEMSVLTGHHTGLAAGAFADIHEKPYCVILLSSSRLLRKRHFDKVGMHGASL